MSVTPFSAADLTRLACPACHSALRLEVDESSIGCTGCGRSFALVDGLPVLIAFEQPGK